MAPSIRTIFITSFILSFAFFSALFISAALFKRFCWRSLPEKNLFVFFWSNLVVPSTPTCKIHVFQKVQHLNKDEKDILLLQMLSIFLPKMISSLDFFLSKILKIENLSLLCMVLCFHIQLLDPLHLHL